MRGQKIMKIAVTGKGGVGKTVIAGALAYFLRTKGFRVLAVDADPNANLAYTLGLNTEEAKQIIPISENSDLIEEKTGANPASYGTVFKLSFTVDDIIERYATETPCGVDLLVTGVVREAGAGCMCPVNHLLRMLLRHLLVRRKEAVVADMEAGTEHLGRGTAKYVDAMLVVVEPSVKAFETAQSIRNFAVQMEIEKVLLVANKVLDEKDEAVIRRFAERSKIPLLGLIHYDPAVREADLSGVSVFLASPYAQAVREIEAVCDRLVEMSKNRGV
jgi:CO dehydrogenase maturation factor